MVLSDSVVLNILSVVVVITTTIILFYKKKFRYWKDLGIETIEATIPFGSASNILLRKVNNGEFNRNIYNYFKSKKAKYGGSYFFYTPIFTVIDLDLIKRIMQRDFAHFTDHGAYVNEKDDPLTAHLFSLGGQKWRNLRTKLTPTFTSGKMKNMFPIMVQISEELVKVLQIECEKGNSVESKEISGRFTTDVIGSCAFGLECNSLANPNTEFRMKGKRVFNLTWFEGLKNFWAFVFPNVSRFFGVRVLPKVSADFFWKVIKDTVDYRQQTGFRRNDAMQLLLEMMAKDDNDSNENTLTFRELAAQAFVFFIAGFETSSSLMSFALLELAIHQEIQDKLRENINATLKQNGNELTYTAIQEMKYLEMVINETLRKYAPLPALSRICTKDYLIPNTNIVLKKGIAVMIPVEGIHYDPEYYPNPEKFDPTRFSDENKSKRHQFAFLPFGEGPRLCIGIRFGFMQAKVGLASIVRNFRIKLNPRTSIPVKMDPKNFLTTALGDILLDLEKI